MSGIRVFPIECKSMMTKSGIPSLDYAINPYLGCAHGCVYCYATFMARFKDIRDPWGSFVGFKERAPEVIRREVGRRTPGVVSFGTVCDAYQPVERQLRITRACLEAFIGASGFDVGILTKSDLVLRDIDVLERLESVDVGFSITTLDPAIAAKLEPGASPPARRLAAMSELARRGISVWGFFGPVLPTLSDSEDDVREVITEIGRAGADRVLVDSMNLYPKVLSSYRRFLSERFPERLVTFDAVRDDFEGYSRALRGRVERVAREVETEVDTCF
ncbi:MAG: radical SAM protein [Candidatus Eisenbacteria bacterium]|nr:radical SAM protein [Candidatus Eisenbacteria bacterium]